LTSLIIQVHPSPQANMKTFLSVILAAGAACAVAFDPSAPALHDDLINMVNNGESNWKAGRNARFEGATLGDVAKTLGTKIFGKDVVRAREALAAWPNARLESLPKSFDTSKAWPQCASMINHVRDQANCGSCWAFGSTEAFNDRMCIEHNVTTEFSAQDTASCCNLFGGCFGSSGCDGGIPSEAWSYFTSTGVVSGGDYDTIGSGSSCFPYQLANCDHHEPGPFKTCEGDAATPACPNPKACSESKYGTAWASDKHFAKSSYAVPTDVQGIKSEIAQYGSVTAAFTVYSDFLTYTSGVYSHKTGSAVGGHAVKIQGWGVENGQEYWLVLNSWNSHWGENGFFKILSGVDECGIESQIVAGHV